MAAGALCLLCVLACGAPVSTCCRWAYRHAADQQHLPVGQHNSSAVVALNGHGLLHIFQAAAVVGDDVLGVERQAERVLQCGDGGGAAVACDCTSHGTRWMSNCVNEKAAVVMMSLVFKNAQAPEDAPD